MTIATTLRRLREKCGLTQTEVCERAKISQGTYSDYENGNTVPKIQTMSRLADVFGVSVAVIDPSLLKIGSTADPFLQIVNANWEKLPIEERARIAGIVSEIAAKPAPARKQYCPICHAELPADWKDGETHECPKCKQHIRFKS